MMATDECMIGVYGTLRRHLWIDSEALGEDAYSLFNEYAEALRLSSSATYPEYSSWADVVIRPRDRAVMWGMNEAEGNWSDEVEHAADHVLWVQVGLSELAMQVGMPIAQFVVCAEKVLERIGIVDLAGVQMLLPVGKAPAPLREWFAGVLATADPAKSAVLRIEIEGGEDDTCIRRAAQIVDELNEACERDGIRFASPSISHSSSYVLDEHVGMDRTAWLGRSVGRIDTHVSVPEFSLDTSSYLAAHIARASQLAGVTGSVITSIRTGLD